MWDGADTTICPHGLFLNLGDTAACGCRLRIVTKDDLIIDPGPYNPRDPNEEMENARMKIGLEFPEGRMAKTPRRRDSSSKKRGAP